MAVYYASNPLQQCIVCGRQFIRHRDKVCEVDCAERGAKASAPPLGGPTPVGASLRRVPSALTTVAFYTEKKFMNTIPKVTSRFESLSCSACGRRVKRKSRQQLYCSGRCRQYALRENKARTAIKNASGYRDSGAVTKPHFLSSKNSELRGPKSGASIPLNVLGGYRWPNVVGADRELLRKIVRAEIGDTR